MAGVLNRASKAAGTLRSSEIATLISLNGKPEIVTRQMKTLQDAAEIIENLQAALVEKEERERMEKRIEKKLKKLQEEQAALKAEKAKAVQAMSK